MRGFPTAAARATPESRSNKSKTKLKMTQLSKFEKAERRVRVPISMEVVELNGKKTIVGCVDRDVFPYEPGEVMEPAKKFTDMKEFANHVSSLIVSLSEKL